MFSWFTCFYYTRWVFFDFCFWVDVVELIVYRVVFGADSSGSDGRWAGCLSCKNIRRQQQSRGRKSAVAWGRMPRCFGFLCFLFFGWGGCFLVLDALRLTRCVSRCCVSRRRFTSLLDMSLDMSPHPRLLRLPRPLDRGLPSTALLCQDGKVSSGPCGKLTSPCALVAGPGPISSPLPATALDFMDPRRVRSTGTTTPPGPRFCLPTPRGYWLDAAECLILRLS